MTSDGGGGGTIPVHQYRSVRFRYKNHRGQTSERHVLPSSLHFTTSTWHHEPQWLLRAYDFDRKGIRDFAMRDISEWRAGDAIDDNARP